MSVGGSMSSSPATVARPGGTAEAGCWLALSDVEGPLEVKLSHRNEASNETVKAEERIATPDYMRRAMMAA